MASLLASSVCQAKPCLTSDVDYAEPIPITMKTLHTAGIIVCFSTKAVHLELASYLSSETFLATFKRFITRHGQSTYLHHILTVYTWTTGKQASNLLSLLSKVLGTQLLSFDEIYTVLTQIEASLSPRPLCAISMLPEQDFTKEPANRLNRWSLNSICWHTEYLQQLQPRDNCVTNNDTLKIDELVLIRDNNLPPLRWRRAHHQGTAWVRWHCAGGPGPHSTGSPDAFCSQVVSRTRYCAKAKATRTAKRTGNEALKLTVSCPKRFSEHLIMYGKSETSGIDYLTYGTLGTCCTSVSLHKKNGILSGDPKLRVDEMTRRQFSALRIERMRRAMRGPEETRVGVGALTGPAFTSARVGTSSTLFPAGTDLGNCTRRLLPLLPPPILEYQPGGLSPPLLAMRWGRTRQAPARWLPCTALHEAEEYPEVELHQGFRNYCACSFLEQLVNARLLCRSCGGNVLIGSATLGRLSLLEPEVLYCARSFLEQLVNARLLCRSCGGNVLIGSATLGRLSLLEPEVLYCARSFLEQLVNARLLCRSCGGNVLIGSATLGRLSLLEPEVLVITKTLLILCVTSKDNKHPLVAALPRRSGSRSGVATLSWKDSCCSAGESSPALASCAVTCGLRLLERHRNILSSAVTLFKALRRTIQCQRKRGVKVQGTQVYVSFACVAAHPTLHEVFGTNNDTDVDTDHGSGARNTLCVQSAMRHMGTAGWSEGRWFIGAEVGECRVPRRKCSVASRAMWQRCSCGACCCDEACWVVSSSRALSLFIISLTCGALGGHRTIRVRGMRRFHVLCSGVNSRGKKPLTYYSIGGGSTCLPGEWFLTYCSTTVSEDDQIKRCSRLHCDTPASAYFMSHNHHCSKRFPSALTHSSLHSSGFTPSRSFTPTNTSFAIVLQSPVVRPSPH
ncbi:hypothetical protein PR048_019369 [Dryococelus australis]|uniref:DUF5641 domain-containing protein n=1 Tax=Dryococelus australis TaxID=614101 RepID=A0ABQ9H3N2_9NEOP|nr:hypothetical protein PR048_019369 [Dryococelus australis]